jgi:WLM domain
MRVLFSILGSLALICILTTREDPRLTALKQSYYSFISDLPPKYSKLSRPSVITGTYGTSGEVGSNVNKGSEIFMCLDGNEPYDQMHILIHELAHTTVSEYDHSSLFWNNFKELKELAERRGLYREVRAKQYCGKMIGDRD